MIVCVCHQVSEGRIRQVIGQGASSPAEVEAGCAAGSDCGGCIDIIDDLLNEPINFRGANGRTAPSCGDPGVTGLAPTQAIQEAR